MTAKVAKLGSLIIPGKSAADLSDVITQIVTSYAVDQLCELTIDLVDPGNKLTKSPLAARGTVIDFLSETWKVGSLDTTLTESGASITMRARDELAKAMRSTYKTSAEKKVSPSDWVRGRVRIAGGTVFTQPSAKTGTIAQSKSQTVLDVVTNLANDLDWSWVSYCGIFAFASRYYVWSEGIGSLPTWQLTWKKQQPTDALEASFVESSDDTTNVATLDCSMTYEAGKSLRPWHRLVSTLPGAEGTWLIDTVTVTHDGTTPVRISASKPHTPRPKPGSSRKES